MAIKLELYTPELSSLCPSEMGAKAQGLWKMQAASLPVPVWWAVPPVFFEHYLTCLGISKEQVLIAWEQGIDTWLVLGIRCKEASESKSEQFGVFELKQLLSSLLQQSGIQAWAIRSSSAWEDQSKQSFAGLFASFFLEDPPSQEPEEIRLQALLTKITDCWQAVFSEQVWHYGHKYNFSPKSLKMAVILQELKTPKSSGVWFDIHPQGAFHEGLLIAAFGLGEGVVQSQVETDHWVYHRTQKAWKANINTKNHRVIMSSNGPICESIPESIEPCLSERDLEQFLVLLAKHQDNFKTPQDIEWCLDQDGFWFLQSRPITTLQAGAPLILDASNIGESYPGVISPLTFSVVRRGYAVNFYHTLALLGMPQSQLKIYQPRLMQMVALIGGRIYYNLGQWQALLSLLPGISKTAQTSFSEMIGTQQDVSVVKEKPLSYFRVYPRLLMALGAFSLQQKKYCFTLDRLITEFESADLEEKNTGDLILLYHEHFDKIVSQLAPGLLNDLWLSLCSSLSKKYYLKVADQDALVSEQNWSQLLAGISDLPSKDALYELLRLLPQLKSDPLLFQRLDTAVQEEQSPDSWLVLEWPQWYQQVQTYLKEYGFRVANEFLLENPSFVQEPLQLYRWLLQLSQQDLSVERLSAQEVALQKSNQKLFSDLSWHQQIGLSLCLKRCFQAVRRREQVRLFRARMMAAARRFFLHLGKRFHSQGLLEFVEDVFYLTEAEIVDLAQQQAFQSPIDLIKERKQQAGAYRNFELGDDYACFAPHFPEMIITPDLSSDDQEQLCWHGQGCGGGFIQGEVMVAKGLPEPSESQDKVLVVMATDPGWMLHLLQARALIAEQGNLLSHAAILGRELGLPTVVGVPGICQALKTGQEITLNGQTGEIKVLPPPQ